MLDLGKYLAFILSAIFFSNVTFAEERKFNLGKIATKTEIAGWNIDSEKIKDLRVVEFPRNKD